MSYISFNGETCFRKNLFQELVMKVFECRVFLLLADSIDVIEKCCHESFGKSPGDIIR